jgi:hypothetical protein
MKKLLVIYGAAASHVAATHQYVDAFRQHSRFNVDYLCIEHAPTVPSDLSRYDAVWVNYCAGFARESHYPDSVPESLRASLAAFGGPKLVAPQDEYDRTNRLREQLRRVGATVVLTCVPQQYLDCVYPRSMFPDAYFETVLTGYVSDDLLKTDDVRPLAERPIMVGYRGRDLGARYGELARQKAQIGLRVREACSARGIPSDIAIDEASRIYGPAWFDFIKSSRIMLGTESGSNVFDFDGSIMALYKQMKAADPHLSYEKFHPFIAEREKEIDMAQISPRVFEAAAMRTAMVMFRGRYSGLIEPEVHYVALEADYSNLDEVLDCIQDVPALEAMTERAYRDLIASGAYSYRTFVRRVDDLIEAQMRKRPRAELGFAVPPLSMSVVTSRPLGYDAYLLAEVERLRTQLREATEKYEEQGRHLTGAYRDTDRLLAEVRSYGDALNRVAGQMRALEEKSNLIKQEKSHVEEENSRITQENDQFRREFESIRILTRRLLRVVGQRLTMKATERRAQSGCTGARVERVPSQPKPD